MLLRTTPPTSVSEEKKALVVLAVEDSGFLVEFWDGEKYLDVSGIRRPFQYNAEPGRHVFVVGAGGYWALIALDLESGRDYVISIDLEEGGPLIKLHDDSWEDYYGDMWVSKPKNASSGNFWRDYPTDKRIGEVTKVLAEFGKSECADAPPCQLTVRQMSTSPIDESNESVREEKRKQELGAWIILVPLFLAALLVGI